jgi:acyl-CoA hydrolase
MLEPNSRVTKKVAVFMYGNNVRLSDAVACYKACNVRHQSSVETVLGAWYDVWDRDVNQKQKEQYCSMLLKCLAWINGKALEQYEIVKPVVISSKYGTAATRNPGRIRRKIESIHSRVE